MVLQVAVAELECHRSMGSEEGMLINVVARKAPLQRVVVATDFSAGGMRAVTRAARLPLAPGAEVILVHVLPAAARTHRVAASEAREVLEEASSNAAEHAEGATFHSVVAFGDAYHEILRVAEARPRADLVVLGRHGTRRVRDLLIGTTAERVVRHGARPVLIVHRSPKRSYRRLLAALDLPLENSRLSLDLGMRLLGAHGSESRVVHVRDDSIDRFLRLGRVTEQNLKAEQRKLRAEASRAIQAWLKDRDGGAVHWRVSVLEGDPRLRILAFADRHGSDLICLGTHARKGPSRVLLGSVAEGVMLVATCDVLLARPEQAAPPATSGPRRKRRAR